MRSVRPSFSVLICSASALVGFFLAIIPWRTGSDVFYASAFGIGGTHKNAVLRPDPHARLTSSQQTLRHHRPVGGVVLMQPSSAWSEPLATNPIQFHQKQCSLPGILFVASSAVFVLYVSLRWKQAAWRAGTMRWCLMAGAGKSVDITKDYYASLGLTKEATLADIKRAHRRIALKYHPDVSPDATSQQKFREANEAYKILSNAGERQKYDAARTSGSGRFSAQAGNSYPRSSTGKYSSAYKSPATSSSDAYSRIYEWNDQQAMDTGGDSWSSLFSDMLSDLGGKAVDVSKQDAVKKAMKSAPGRVLEDLVDFLETRQGQGRPMNDNDWYEEFMATVNKKGASSSSANAREAPPPPRPKAAEPAAGDLYRTLGVMPTASLDEIKTAYRLKARDLHPDVNPSAEGKRQFQLVLEAYRVLSNPAERQQYDMKMAQGSRRTASSQPKPPPRPSSGPRSKFDDFDVDAQLKELREKLRRENKL